MIYVLIGLAILVISFIVALISLAKESTQQKKAEEQNAANANGQREDSAASAETKAAAEPETDASSHNQDDAREALELRVKELSQSDANGQKEEGPIDALSDMEPFPWEKKQPGGGGTTEPQEVFTNEVAQSVGEESPEDKPMAAPAEPSGQSSPFPWDASSGSSSQAQGEESQQDKFSGVIDFRKKDED